MKRLALILVCLTLVAPEPILAQKKGQKSVKQLKQGLKDIEQTKKNAERKLGQTKANIRSTKDEVAALEDRVTKASSTLETTTSRLDQEKSKQASLAQDLVKAQASVRQTKGQVEKRVRSLYKEGKPSVLEFVFGNKSSSDIATREYIATRVQKADQKLFRDFKSARDEVEKKKKEQDSVVRNVASLQQQQAAHQHELEGAQQDKEHYLKQLENKKDGLQNMLDELESDAAAIASEIRAAEARAREAEKRRMAEAKKKGEVYKPPKHSGGLSRPTGGPVTSGFGNRYHPILHYTRLHAGTDFGGGYGAAVYSAGSGVVIAAGTRGGYGNCVIIDHGNGMSTVYGHLSRIMVSEGQNVSPHQRVGSIGASGLATGPHLHFEVRINGRPVNPMGYL